jgi:hypothetical protein
MTELEPYLRTYLGIPEEDMRTLVSYFHPATMEKGDYFLKQGRICDKLSFHRSGLMRVYAPYGEKEITRLFALLSMTADERYQYLQDHNPDLFNQVPLKYLASMMGMTPESLNRIRNRRTSLNRFP